MNPSDCHEIVCRRCDRYLARGYFAQAVEPIEYATYGTYYFKVTPGDHPYDGLDMAECNALCEARCALIDLCYVWRERNEAARLAR